jgi:hypothetical protein
VTDTVQNQGGAAAGASTTRYYLSLDATKDGSDKLLTGTRSVPALAEGAATVFTDGFMDALTSTHQRY